MCINVRKMRGAWEREKDRGGREKNIFMGRAWGPFSFLGQAPSSGATIRSKRTDWGNAECMLHDFKDLTELKCVWMFVWRILPLCVFGRHVWCWSVFCVWKYGCQREKTNKEQISRLKHTALLRWNSFMRINSTEQGQFWGKGFRVSDEMEQEPCTFGWEPPRERRKSCHSCGFPK